MSWKQDQVGEFILEDYQIAGRDFLLAGRSTKLLADKPRLGKTYQVVAALNIRLQLGGTVWVICPPGIRSNWRAKLTELRDGEWTYFVSGFTDVAAGKLPMGLPNKVDVIVIDEMHNLMTPASARTQAVYGEKCDGVGGAVERGHEVWGLTGSPQPSFPNKIWTHLRALAPDLITNPDTNRPYTYSDFERRYCAKLSNGFGRTVVAGRNLKELRFRIRDWWLGRGYEVLGDARRPPIEEDLVLEPSIEDLNTIRELEQSVEGNAILAALKSGMPLSKLAKSLPKSAVRENLGLAKVGPICEVVSSELDEDEEAKIVLFCWHRSVAQALHKRLKKYGAELLIGGLGADKQDRVKNRFQTDPKCRVVVCQHLAAGEGIDLSAADELIFVEMSWEPVHQEQAMMRIFNIKKLVRGRVRTAVLRGTIDTRIIAANRQKEASSSMVFG